MICSKLSVYGRNRNQARSVANVFKIKRLQADVHDNIEFREQRESGQCLHVSAESETSQPPSVSL